MLVSAYGFMVLGLFLLFMHTATAWEALYFASIACVSIEWHNMLQGSHYWQDVLTQSLLDLKAQDSDACCHNVHPSQISCKFCLMLHQY